MTERQFDAISRLTAWKRDFGSKHNEVFNEDLEIVLQLARRHVCSHERINDHGDACLDCFAVLFEGKWQ